MPGLGELSPGITGPVRGITQHHGGCGFVSHRARPDLRITGMLTTGLGQLVALDVGEGAIDTGVLH